MKNQNKIHLTLKIILITLASMFITNGCERSLEPWGRIEGQLAQGRKADGNKIWMSLLPPKNRGQNNYETVCDENGRFVFNKVPSAWFEVGYLTRTGEGSASITSRTPVEVKAGETSTVTLGGTGRPVTGKFVPPEGFNKSIYFGQGTRSLVTAQPEQPRPDNYDQMTKRQQQQWLNQWVQTEEYKTQRIAYLHNENLSTASDC
ncbi:MAG TPA: hypothetical protein VMW72_07515 [Sedimentisphaerales bacterium]|nr:hypothetical protein [Sedimentisphaerales bacterium]